MTLAAVGASRIRDEFGRAPVSPTYEPRVSVIVPAYNTEATIERCVRSLLELRYPQEKLELRVVDNDSKDSTAERLKPFEGRVVVLHERKRGASAARNAGLAGAGGEVVAFTDADCEVDPDWLRRLVMPLRDPIVGIVGGTIRAGNGANEVERFGEEIHDHQKAIEVFRPPYAITMSWASRREVLGELGGFDERFIRGQDVDLSFRAVQAGYTIAFVASAVVYHRNESNLAGLFREGFVHGFHGVHARKQHEGFLRQFGYRRVDRRAYLNIGSRLLDWARGTDSARSKCDAVFNSGKKAGKLVGSIRFGRVDL
jgi:cellulose synthase/poly-beta-1,6-N-acetylglucosamine synthase-like glycosyltransferase